ncbi:MAG: SMC family ATPase, partial [Bacteroidales bacterium]|nr:SMC family ATPase [Bacteroidales bacterium]
MKFKHLHIHNLASLEEASIDFGHAPLDNPIFLICGETGSGKSTLLDAICLALYDSSPRFKASSTDKFKVAGVFGEVANNNPMQILRENADKGFAELVFEGNDGREYTARWSVRRIRKRGMDEHENARDWTLSFVEDNTEITLKKIDEVKNHIEEAVGLNFEQFCRTSMLAQGEFTKFLKSNDTEKSAILEKLTDTGHFARMGTRIYEKAAGKKRLWEQAGRDMENMQLLSEEQIAEKEAEKAALTERLSRLAEETQTLRKRHEWRKKQEELKRRKAEADEAVKRAQEGVNGEDYCNGKRMLQEWEMSEEARMWLEQSKEAEREAMAAQEGLQAQEREFSVLLGGVKYLEAYIKNLEAKTAEWESLAGIEKGAEVDIPQEENVLRAYMQARNSAERFLEKNATARKTEKEAADLEKACAEWASHTEELTKKAQEAEERLKNAEEDLKTLQKGMGDMAKG